MLVALAIGISHFRAEKHLIDVFLTTRIHHLRVIETPRQKANAPVDFAQTPFAVNVVAVLRAIAVRRRPRHDLHHLRALIVDEIEQLVLQATIAGRGDVILGARGNLRGAGVEIVIVVAAVFFDEGLVHKSMPAQCACRKRYRILAL